MDNERTMDQEKRPGKSSGDRGHKPRRAADGFLLLEALPMLLAAAIFFATGMPQALETAADRANAPAAILKHSEPTDQGDRALERIEGESKPLITDDLRTEGVMYALADVPRAVGCRGIAHHERPGSVGRERC